MLSGAQEDEKSERSGERVRGCGVKDTFCLFSFTMTLASHSNQALTAARSLPLVARALWVSRLSSLVSCLSFLSREFDFSWSQLLRSRYLAALALSPLYLSLPLPSLKL